MLSCGFVILGSDSLVALPCALFWIWTVSYTSLCYVESLSCSAQQRTAANATKKRVMPNQVTHLFKQIHCTPHIKHRSSCFLLLFFLFLVPSVVVSARLSCHCCPLLLHIYILLSVPLLSFLFISLFLFLLFLLFTAQGEILVSIVLPAPPLVTSSLGWVGESTVTQTMWRRFCAPWWRRGKWKSYTHGCIMRAGYPVPRWQPSIPEVYHPANRPKKKFFLILFI